MFTFIKMLTVKENLKYELRTVVIDKDVTNTKQSPIFTRIQKLLKPKIGKQNQNESQEYYFLNPTEN